MVHDIFIKVCRYGCIEFVKWTSNVRMYVLSLSYTGMFFYQVIFLFSPGIKSDMMVSGELRRWEDQRVRQGVLQMETEGWWWCNMWQVAVRAVATGCSGQWWQCVMACQSWALHATEPLINIRQTECRANGRMIIRIRVLVMNDVHTRIQMMLWFVNET